MFLKTFDLIIPTIDNYTILKEFFITVGGDDRRVLLWHLEKASKNSNYKPFVMKGQHDSNIFCVDFDCYNKTVFSGGNDDQVIVHDAET